MRTASADDLTDPCDPESCCTVQALTAGTSEDCRPECVSTMSMKVEGWMNDGCQSDEGKGRSEDGGEGRSRNNGQDLECL